MKYANNTVGFGLIVNWLLNQIYYPIKHDSGCLKTATHFYFKNLMMQCHVIELIGYQIARKIGMQQILLASGSTRRREILENLGFHIKVLPAEIDETPHLNESALAYVQRMALEKNRAAVAQYPHLNSLPILTADTTVSLNGIIFGKPEHATHAQHMLYALSGSVHQVLTAVCVSYQGQQYACIQRNDVRFKSLSHQEIIAYIDTGEPMDKAGAYGIQGVGGAFVVHLSGSFTGVMGLPVFETLQLLQQAGVSVPPFA